MEQLARLENRIGSLKELQDLLSAIKAMAAAHMQIAQTALESVKSYNDVVECAIADAASMPSRTHRDWSYPAATGRSMLIILGSEHGFCGSFNRLVVERSRDVLKDSEAVAVIGRRAAAIATGYEMTPAWISPMATQMDGVLGTARRVAAMLEDTEIIRLVLARYRGATRFEVEVRQVLPPRPELFEPRRGHAAPLHHLRPARLIHTLLVELLLSELMLALTDSFASENAARFRVMQAANQSIEDKLSRLTRASRQLRQDTITSELLEIVTGSEAVSASRAKAENSI
ncbi:MAG: F0F1 ATP synthase subunit gamma [Hyphomicrobiaceae bacterium]